MAERTQAEMLADLERALARQDADRELFERPTPVEREFAYGIPGVQEEGTLPSQLLSYLIPARTEVLQPPVTEFGEPRTQLNPITNQLEEVVDRTVTPGVYGETEFGLQYTPIVRGIGSLVDYAQELIDSPKARSQLADTVSRLPEQMAQQLVGGADALERGRLQTVDPKTGQEFYAAEALLAAPVPLAAARAIAGAPEGTSLGVLGGSQGVETSKTIAQYQDRVMNNLEPRQVVEKELEVGIGADGLPRAYMGDFELKNDALNEAVRQPGQKMKLEDLVEAPEYFRNYPDMARVEVDVENMSSSGTRTEVLPVTVAERRGAGMEDFLRSEDLNFYDGPTNTVYLGGGYDKKRNFRAAMQSFVSQKEGFAEPKLFRETAEIVAPLALPVGTINEAQRNFSALFSSRNFFEPITDPVGIVANRFTNDIFTPAIEGGPNYEGVAGQTFPRKRTNKLKDLLPLNFYQLRRALGTDAGMPGESGGEFDTLMDQDIYNNQMREKYKDGTAGRFLSEKLGEAIETLPRPLSQRGVFGLINPSTPQSDAVATLQELQQKLAAVPPSLFTTLYENAMQQAPRIAAADAALAKQPDVYYRGRARFDIGATDRLASEERAKQLASLEAERDLSGPVIPPKQQTMQELLQPAIDDAIVADTQMFRQNVRLNEPGGLTPVSFAEARNANLQKFGIPPTAENIGLYDPFSPFTSQTRRALDFVQRTQGTPEQFIADLKKVTEKQALRIRPKDLDASGLLKAMKETASGQRGKLTKDDVSLLLTNIDRPPQFSRYARGGTQYATTSLPGDIQRQEMWVLHSPPRADDSLAFAEEHVSQGRNQFIAIDELDDYNTEYPNTLVHLRGKPHMHNTEEKEVFVVEELQSELKDKETKIAADQSTLHGGSIQNQYNPLTVPGRYLKSYETALERMLVESARNEQDFAVVSGAQSNVIQKNLTRDYSTEYDREIPKIMNRLAKKYGLEYKDIEIELTDRFGDSTSKQRLMEESLGDNPETASAYFSRLGAEERFDEEQNAPIVVMKVKGFELPLEKRKEILSKGVPFFAQGGEVNQMRKPVISSGLSGLLRSYTTGPLAPVPRGTQEPVGMRRGGMMRNLTGTAASASLFGPDPRKAPAFDSSRVGFFPTSGSGLPSDLIGVAPPAIIPDPPQGDAGTSQVSARNPTGSSRLLGYDKRKTPFMDTSRVGFFPKSDSGLASNALQLPMASKQARGEPGALLTQDEADRRAQQLAATEAERLAAAEAARNAAAAEAARIAQEEADRVAAEEAARIAAEQEAARIAAEQAAALAAQQEADRLAAEQLAAEEAARVAAEQEAARIAAEQEALRIANQQAAQQEADRLAQEAAARLAAEEAARIAAEQQAAEQLASEQLAAEQAAADSLAQQEAEKILLAQEEAIRIADEQAAAELVAQQEAERIAIEQAAAVEAERLAAERLAAETLAAEEAAAQAEAIRLAEEEAQRIAAEQAAAADEQAALEALAVRQAAEEAAALAAEQEALAAAEAERVAAAQLASEQLAAQQAAQLVADQEAASQLQAAEQLAAQQAADRIAMEAQIAATPDPDPIYEAPTQGELLQAAAQAEAASDPLFTTPTDTGTVIDRGSYGQVPEPVTTTTTTAQQQPAGLSLSGIQTLLNKVDLDVGDTISDYISGYPSTQGMEIQRTYMPFEGTEEERATGYVMPVYKPVAQQPMPSLFQTRDATTGSEDSQASSEAPGPDSGTINTGSQATAPGTYGLKSNQMYQCPNRYTLSFVNGNPVCNLVGGGGPGMKRQVPPTVIEINPEEGMRSGGEVRLRQGIGSFGV